VSHFDGWRDLPITKRELDAFWAWHGRGGASSGAAAVAAARQAGEEPPPPVIETRGKRLHPAQEPASEEIGHERRDET
jgi:hypothetical protein